MDKLLATIFIGFFIGLAIIMFFPEERCYKTLVSKEIINEDNQLIHVRSKIICE